MSLGLDRGWRERTVAALALERRSARCSTSRPAPATSRSQIARAPPDATVVGLDPSREMLRVAQRKARRPALADRARAAASATREQLPFDRRERRRASASRSASATCPTGRARCARWRA